MSVAEDDGVDRPDLSRPFLHVVDEGEGRDLVRHGQIKADEADLSQESDCPLQFVRRNLERCISQGDAAFLQGRVLHFR